MTRAVPRATPTGPKSLTTLVVLLALSGTVSGQELPATATVTTQPPPPVAYNPEDLAQRLAAAEAEIRSLKESHGEHRTLLQQAKEKWEEAQDPSITTVDQQTHGASTKTDAKHWYERISIRGYAQFRFNTILSEEQDGAPPQHVGDRSVGHDQSFLIRRARLIFSGDVSDHLYVYLQPDFANTPSGSTDQTMFAQIRDW